MSKSFQDIGSEVVALWRGLPNRGVFVALFVAWSLLFVFYGNNTFGHRDTTSLFDWMYYVYTTSPDDDYCLIIPFLVLGLLIWKRHELSTIKKNVWWPAFLLFLVGVALHLVGYLVQQNRISLIGYVIGLYGLTGWLWGRTWLAASFFPMFLLLFLVPLGTINDALTLPLRLFVTQVAVMGGNLFLGLGYQAQGALILTEAGIPAFDVAPACSGIRSLVSLFALATIYAFTQFSVNWKRMILIVSAIPLAVLGNLVRLCIVLTVGRAVGFDAAAAVEQKLGFLTFLIAFVGLFYLGRVLGEDDIRPRDPEAPEGEAVAS